MCIQGWLAINIRKNAKALCFDALVEKEGLCTRPRKGEHHTIQLNPKAGLQLWRRKEFLLKSAEEIVH
jgi:hypothetical protein